MRPLVVGAVALTLAACAGAPPAPEPARVSAKSLVPGTIGALVEPATQGVRVSAVDPGGPAARAGLAHGDLIMRVDGKPVPTVREFNTHVVSARPGKRMRLEVLRGPQRISVDTNVEQLRTAWRI